MQFFNNIGTNYHITLNQGKGNHNVNHEKTKNKRTGKYRWIGNGIMRPAVVEGI